MKLKLFTLVLCLSVAGSVAATSFFVKDVEYTITDETALIVEVSGCQVSLSNVVSIPSVVTYNSKEYSVKTIGTDAFANNKNITQVIIPVGVTSIGNSAFRGCTSLASISISNSVTSIESWAFRNTAITSITIPNSVTNIGKGVFYECKQLTDIQVESGNTDYCSENGCLFNADKTAFILYPPKKTNTSFSIPDGVTSIEYGAFYHSDNLTSITMPNSVMEIEAVAFELCSKLTAIEIPEGVTYIRDATFRNCSALSAVTLPNELRSIEIDAFNGCTILPSIVIPDKVTKIEYGAFEDCYALAAVTIGNSVSYIAENTFYGTAIASIDIPGSVKYIGVDAFSNTPLYRTASNWKDNVLYIDNCLIEAKKPLGSRYAIEEGTRLIADNAFEGCSNLSSVSIPGSVVNIGANVFIGTALYTNESNWENNVLYIDKCMIKAQNTLSGNYEIAAGTRLIADMAFWYCSNLQQVTIPDGVTSIGAHAFSSCGNLSSINLPNTVAYIGYGAFVSCYNIASMTIPDAVTSIGHETFNECSSLTQINWGNNITSIGEMAFSSCYNITSITIPEKVEYLGDNMFDGCKKLASLTVLPVTPPIVQRHTFDNMDMSIPVYVPFEALNEYTGAALWKDFNLQAIQTTSLQASALPAGLSIYNGTLYNPQGQSVRIFDIQGHQVYIGRDVTVSQPEGIYIVRCAGISRKVIF